MKQILEIQNQLSHRLKPGRYTHTLGVMYTAASLAMCYGESIDKAMLAGLLHDCGKCCSEIEQISLCRDFGIGLTKSDLEMPALIHAKFGAYLAKVDYHITDSEIISAITFHTTGRPKMTVLEKIVYIADFIEPRRQKIPVLDEVRATAFSNINKAVYLSAKSTVTYLNGVGKSIDTMTIQTLDYYQTLI